MKYFITFLFSHRLPSALANSIEDHKTGDQVEAELQLENESDRIPLDAEQIHLNGVESFDDVPDTSQTDDKSNPQPSSSKSVTKSAFPTSNFHRPIISVSHIFKR